MFTRKLYFSLKKTFSHQKSRNLFTHKITQPPKNIARIAKHCPENITSVVKCVKLLFPKYFFERSRNFFTTLSTVTAVTTVTFHFYFFFTFKKNFLSIFGKSNLTHLTTDVNDSPDVFLLLHLICFVSILVFILYISIYMKTTKKKILAPKKYSKTLY